MSAETNDMRPPVVETVTSEFAPDLNEIIDDISQIDSPRDLLAAISKTDWDGLIKLYSAPQLSDDIRNQNIDSLASYNTTALAKYEALISGKRQAALISLNQNFRADVLGHVINWLNGCNITYQKIKEVKDSLLDHLKSSLNQWYQSHTDRSFLYDMVVTDNLNLLSIDLTYTELGFLIMLQTEIRHDLAHLPQNILSEIDAKIQTGITDRNLKNMCFNIDGLRISYTEEIASDLCLYLLNLKQIPRVVQKHGQTELQIGGKEVGHGIFPAVYANSDLVSLTSDSSNVANVEYSQLRGEQLQNNNGTNYPFLNLDAGSAPTMIGYKDSMERTAELMELESETKPPQNENTKPVIIHVYNPTRVKMVTIESDDMNSYKITIYPSNAYSSKKQKVSPTVASKSVEISPVVIRDISNLSITTVTEIVTTLVQPSHYFNASILKSLGDLIPYITVCLQNTLKHNQGTTNVVGSIDYSMIFQTLGNITFVQNDVDVTQKLNTHTLLVGVNLGSANVYFPWSKREKSIYQTLHAVNFMLNGQVPAGNIYTKLRREIEEFVSKFAYDLYKNTNSTLLLAQTDLDYLKNVCILNPEQCGQFLAPFYVNDTDDTTKLLVRDTITKFITGIKSFGTTFVQLSLIITDRLSRSASETTDMGVVRIDKLDYAIANLIVDAGGRQTSDSSMSGIGVKRRITMGGKSKKGSNRRRTKRKYAQKR
jgi:hypothetical protein